MRRLPVFLVLGVLLYSCASIGRIEGGPIDETPPRFLQSTPEPGQLNYKRNRVTIAFDEYIKLDNPSEKIVISPPQIQQPEIKTNGKKVVINFQDTMKADVTYTIDFGDAIQDNNEGNPLEQFTFTFSTGERLDTMAASGTVLNASNLEPVKGMLVGLQSNLADSAFTSLPFERWGVRTAVASSPFVAWLPVPIASMPCRMPTRTSIFPSRPSSWPGPTR